VIASMDFKAIKLDGIENKHIWMQQPVLRVSIYFYKEGSANM
jgi:hypothetical protein